MASSTVHTDRRHPSLPVSHTALLAATTVLPALLPAPVLAQACDAGAVVVVDGAGGGTQPSPWNTPGALVIGVDGECEVVVRNAGEVRTPYNTGHVVLGQNQGSHGTLEVTGAGSALLLSGTGGVGGQPGITVGDRGLGTMTIADGGRVESFGGILGFYRGSAGAVTVTGPGSRWEASSLIVGGYDGGQGQLAISDGGVVATSGQSHVGLHGGPGRQDGAHGTVLVTGAGSRWEGGGNLHVGAGSPQGGATGAMTVEDGGVVTSNRGMIGVGHADARGTVAVSGAGSRWQAGDMVVVGTGSLIVSGGGAVALDSPFDQSLRIGSDGTGRVEVSGTDAGTGDRSHLRLDGILHVGYSGSGGGELLVGAGALVESGQGLVGAGDSAIGTPATATVTGAGSEWIVGDAVEVGTLGRLRISAGGSVQSASGVVGSQAYGAGNGVSGAVVEVTGAGSRWTTDGPLTVGRNGPGTLTVSDQGQVRVGSTGTGTIRIARDPASTATLHLGAREGEAPGRATLEAGRIEFGAGHGTLVVNHAGEHRIDAALSGPAGNGVIHHLAGNTTLAGDGSGFGGSTVLAGGALHVAQALGGEVEVHGGARLSGGEFGGSVTVLDGTLAPGASAGLMTIGGDLALDAGATLEFELGAADGTPGIDSDLVRVANDLILDGTLHVLDAGGFGPGLYRLLEYGGTLTDRGLEIGIAPPGFDAGNLAVQTAIAQQVNLLVGTPAAPPASYFFWDGTDTSGNAVVDGGSGEWTATGGNWTSADATANGPFDPEARLVFAGTPGEVTVDDGEGAIVLSAGMQFAVDGYSVVGDGIRLEQAPVVRVGDGTAAGAGMTATITSAIDGVDGLVKTDLGTLALRGANRYTGGTRIEAGTLRIWSDAALGAAGGGVTLRGGADGATLAFASALSSDRAFTFQGSGNVLRAEDGTVSLSGRLSGAGEVAKHGAGQLHYTGDGTGFSGRLSLAEGGLRLEGTLAGSITTSAGTVLSGSGETGSLRVGGRLEPGASIGTLTVRASAPSFEPTGAVALAVRPAAAEGDLTLASGATYVVEINDGGNTAGVHNDLVVADAGTIQGGVTFLVTPENGRDDGRTYAPGTTYTIIRTGAAGGLVVEAPPTIVDDFAFLDFTGSTDGRHYYLTSRQVASFCLGGFTFNQCSTANAVEDLGPGHPAHDAVLALGGAAAPAAFDAMSGEVHASARHVVDHAGAAFNRILRQRGAGGATIELRADDNGGRQARRAWVAPLGTHGDIDGDGNAARTRWWGVGLAGGVERTLELGRGDLVAGLGAGHVRSKGSIPDRRSHHDGYGTHLGAYGAWSLGQGRVAGSLSYGATRTATRRGIGFGAIDASTRADSRVHGLAASIEASYAFELAGGGTLAPLLMVEAGRARHGRFSEQGAGDFDLSAGPDHWSRFDAGVGLALARTVPTARGVLALDGRATWEYAMGDTMQVTMNSFAGGTGYEIRGPRTDENRLRIGAGAAWTVSRAVDIRARYDGLFSRDQASHMATLAVDVRF